MNIESLRVVCFSPTGTSKAISKAIAQEIKSNFRQVIDITTPKNRENTLKTKDNELLIVAVPVYMGRIPAFLNEWFQSIEALNTPAVCIVVYGNRDYDDALLELRDILTKRGCKPIACAAYVGEHSFSSPEYPTAQGRPDSKDLKHAESFARKINEKILSLSSVEEILKIEIPGNYPYCETRELWKLDFIKTNSNCVQCGICIEGCPKGAINKDDPKMIDKEKCVLCCACIKNCPQEAKTMKEGLMKDTSKKIHNNLKERKEPVIFL